MYGYNPLIVIRVLFDLGPQRTSLSSLGGASEILLSRTKNRFKILWFTSSGEKTVINMKNSKIYNCEHVDAIKCKFLVFSSQKSLVLKNKDYYIICLWAHYRINLE